MTIILRPLSVRKRAKPSQCLTVFTISNYARFLIGAVLAVAPAFDVVDARAAETAGSSRSSSSDTAGPSGPISDGLLVWETVEKGKDAATDRFVVSFKNVSSEHVALLRVEPSCGCTTVKLPTLPQIVPPGQGVQIDVSVDLTGKDGTLLNTITFVTTKGSKVIGLQTVIPSPLAAKAADVGSARIVAPVDQQPVRNGAMSAVAAPARSSAGNQANAKGALPPPPLEAASRPIPADAVDKSVLTWISEKPVPIVREGAIPSEGAVAPAVPAPETASAPALPPPTKAKRRRPTTDPSCLNGDLEDGNLNGWVGYYGSRLNSASISLNALQQGVIPSRLAVVGPGTDPYIGSRVAEGNYALQIGNALPGGEADAASYTFTVTPQNQHFSFRYAVVLQNPLSHTPAQQPFFSYYILRGNSIIWSPSNMPIASAQILADRTNPFFTVAANDVVYRPWTTVCLDLSNYLGQTMTIAFFTADCAFSGSSAHYGYAYIDGLCLNNDPTASFTMPAEVCAGAPVNVDGSASTKEDSYFWSVEQSDANWGRNPGTEISNWFVAQQAGPLNLTDPQGFYVQKGGSFKCNTYYRIKLAVTNQCNGWVETVKLLHVRCPVVTAGPDLCVSCKPTDVRVQLGIGNSPTNTYVWTPSTGLDNPSSPSPMHSQGSVSYPFTYTVTATDAMGCTASDSVTLYCQPPTLNLVQRPGCCSVTLLANAQNYTSIEWSNGATNVPSIDVRTPGVYTVVTRNPCGATSGSVTVATTAFLTGPAHPISYNSMFNPPSGSGALRDKLYIMDVVSGNGAANVPNSYNVTQYKLEIFDRWGNLFKTITPPAQSCTGFNNWAINWDGTDQTGQLVQQDVYVWKLTLTNCDGWQPTVERKFVDPQCIKWVINLFGIKLWCKKWDHPGPTTVDVPMAAGSVTVIR